MLYGPLAGALLIGLAGIAIGGLWWPTRPLVIAVVAWRAGRRLRHDRPIPRTTG